MNSERIIINAEIVSDVNEFPTTLDMFQWNEGIETISSISLGSYGNNNYPTYIDIPLKNTLFQSDPFSQIRTLLKKGSLSGEYIFREFDVYKLPELNLLRFGSDFSVEVFTDSGQKVRSDLNGRVYLPIENKIYLIYPKSLNISVNTIILTYKERLSGKNDDIDSSLETNTFEFSSNLDNIYKFDNMSPSKELVEIDKEYETINGIVEYSDDLKASYNNDIDYYKYINVSKNFTRKVQPKDSNITDSNFTEDFNIISLSRLSPYYHIKIESQLIQLNKLGSIMKDGTDFKVYLYSGTNSTGNKLIPDVDYKMRREYNEILQLHKPFSGILEIVPYFNNKRLIDLKLTLKEKTPSLTININDLLYHNRISNYDINPINMEIDIFIKNNLNVLSLKKYYTIDGSNITINTEDLEKDGVINIIIRDNFDTFNVESQYYLNSYAPSDIDNNISIMRNSVGNSASGLRDIDSKIIMTDPFSQGYNLRDLHMESYVTKMQQQIVFLNDIDNEHLYKDDDYVYLKKDGDKFSINENIEFDKEIIEDYINSMNEVRDSVSDFMINDELEEMEANYKHEILNTGLLQAADHSRATIMTRTVSNIRNRLQLTWSRDFGMMYMKLDSVKDITNLNDFNAYITFLGTENPPKLYSEDNVLLSERDGVKEGLFFPHIRTYDGYSHNLVIKDLILKHKSEDYTIIPESFTATFKIFK